ncbi:MAG TPA: PQQ-dependent sugar dehydrogenase [Thermohalobaculum sp.]|nr:PQQ-dependent sugar dehydrogenase [Thermohalobaculum sp.]
MRYALLLLLAAATGTALYLGLTAPRAAPDARSFETSAGEVVVERVVGPFAHPWAVGFLPGGAMLVTERGGKLWHLGPDGTRAEVAGVPTVHAAGQGGLLDVVPARDFAESREIFLTYSEPREGGSATALAVARLSAGAETLENLRVIFRQQPAVQSSKHYGSRVVEAPDGTLWVTLGDRGLPTQAQIAQSHLGKVVRINRDGSVPDDNPYRGGIARPELWSIGHRNAQGAALDPETGALWTVAHGPKGGDEINRPEPGRNYGWPLITYGVDYSGMKVGEGTHKEGMEQPLHYWDPSIAPSGMAIYSGRLWPQWAGDIFVGALKFRLISRLEREGDAITGEERLFEGVYGRVRDVREGPDGALWFVTDEADGGLYRVRPAK